MEAEKLYICFFFNFAPERVRGEIEKLFSASVWTKLRFLRSIQCVERFSSNGIVTQGSVVLLVVYQRKAVLIMMIPYGLPLSKK